MLTLVATPIGNLGDLSPRASEALTNADLWIVEDTRVSGKLGSHLGVRKAMRVLNDHTTSYQIDALLKDLKAGMNVCLLTDGGCPAISDPGARLTDLALQEGIDVDGIPGPSAVTDALMVSGFYAQRFAFLGFLGRKPGAIKEELAMFSESPLTLVLFESPHRLEQLLKVGYEVLGVRRYAVCRELTKSHQQIYRKFLPDCPNDEELPKKGEVTVVIEGKRKTDVSL